MPSQNSLQGLPSTAYTDRDTNADVVVTVPAPGSVRGAIAVFGWLITGSAVAAAAVEAILTDGTTTIKINVPATVCPEGFAYAFPSGHPWVAKAGEAVTLTVPALGSGVICNATLFANYVTPL